MTKTKRTPEQKLARRIQKETDMPYTQCLGLAKEKLAGQARTEAGPVVSP